MGGRIRMNYKGDPNDPCPGYCYQPFHTYHVVAYFWYQGKYWIVDHATDMELDKYGFDDKVLALEGGFRRWYGPLNFYQWPAEQYVERMYNPELVPKGRKLDEKWTSPEFRVLSWPQFQKCWVEKDMEKYTWGRTHDLRHSGLMWDVNQCYGYKGRPCPRDEEEVKRLRKKWPVHSREEIVEFFSTPPAKRNTNPKQLLRKTVRRMIR